MNAKRRLVLIGLFLLFSTFICQAIAEIKTKQQRRDFYKNAKFVCQVHGQLGVDFNNTVTKSSGTLLLPPGDAGSCSIVSYRKRKYILTNAHVVTIPEEIINQVLASVRAKNPAHFQFTKVRIIFLKIHLKTNPQTSIDVEPKYPDPNIDLALLDPTDKNFFEKMKAAPLGNEKDIEVTDLVMSISNPGDLHFIFNSGSIAGIDRRLKNGKRVLLIITTPMTDMGSSGSPLLNDQGHCIGINYGGYFNRSIPYSIFIHVRDIKHYLKSIPVK